MTGELSRGTARWKYSTGEDAGYLQLDEKTPEALLQFDIEYMLCMRSVDGRIWSVSLGICGSDSEIPFLLNIYSNLHCKTMERQYLMGSFSGALSSRIWMSEMALESSIRGAPRSLVHFETKKLKEDFRE